jgi:hypothetical protein
VEGRVSLTYRPAKIRITLTRKELAMIVGAIEDLADSYSRADEHLIADELALGEKLDGWLRDLDRTGKRCHHADGWVCHRGHTVPPGVTHCVECRWVTERDLCDCGGLKWRTSARCRDCDTDRKRAMV